MVERIPEFKSVQEIAAFWDTHDAADYAGEFEPVELEVAANENNCPRCGGEMEMWWIDLPLAHDLLILRRAKFWRCRTPGCHTVVLPADTHATLTQLQKTIDSRTLEELALAAAREELALAG